MVRGAELLRGLGYSEDVISSIPDFYSVRLEGGSILLAQYYPSGDQMQSSIISPPTGLKTIGMEAGRVVVPPGFSKTSLTQNELSVSPAEMQTFIEYGSAGVEAERAVPMVTYEYPLGFGEAGVPDRKSSGLTLSVMTPSGLRPSFAPSVGATEDKTKATQPNHQPTKEIKYGRKPLALAEGMADLSFLTPNEITGTEIVRETPISSRLRFEKTAEVLRGEWDAFAIKHPGKEVSQAVFEKEYLPLKEKTEWFREKYAKLIWAYETLVGGEYVIGAQQTYPTIERQPLVSPYSPFVPSTQLGLAELGIEYTEFAKRLEGGLIGTTLTAEERKLHKQKRKEISEELQKLPYGGLPEGIMKELIPLEFSVLIGYGGVSAFAGKGLVGLGTYGLGIGGAIAGGEIVKAGSVPALKFIAPGREEWRYEAASEALGFAGMIVGAKVAAVPAKAIESKVLAGKFVPEPYGSLLYVGRDKELNYIFEGKVSFTPAKKDIISKILFGRGETKKLKFAYDVEAKAGMDLSMDYLKPIGLKFKGIVSPSVEKFGKPVFEAESWVSFKPSKTMKPYFVSGESFGGQVRTYLKVPKVVGIGALKKGGIPEEYWLRFEPQMKISQTIGKIKTGKKVIEFGQFGQPDLSKFRVGYSKTRLQFESVVPIKGSVLEQVKGLKFLDQLAKKHDVPKEMLEKYLNELTYKEYYKSPNFLRGAAGSLWVEPGAKPTMFIDFPKIQEAAIKRGISFEKMLAKVISHETSHAIDKLTAKLPELRNLPYKLQPSEIRAWAFMEEAQLGKAVSHPFEGQKFLERFSAKYPALIEGELIKGGKGKYTGVINMDLAATQIESRGIKFAGAGKFTGLFKFEKGMFKKVKFKPSTLEMIVAEPLKKSTIANIEKMVQATTQASEKSVQKMLFAQDTKTQKMVAFMEESQRAFFALPEKVSGQAKKMLLTQPRERYFAVVPLTKKTMPAYSAKTISFGKFGLPTMEKEAMLIRPAEKISVTPKSVIGEKIVLGERMRPIERIREKSIEQLAERLQPIETFKAIERMAEAERLRIDEKITVYPRTGIGQKLRIGERIKVGERFKKGERFKFADFVFTPVSPPPPLPPMLLPLAGKTVSSRLTKKLGAGFDVFAKVRGKMQKLNKLSLLKESALGIGASYAEQYPAATFQLVPTAEAGFKLLGAPKFRPERFRMPIKKGMPQFGTGKFIEKNKYRINMPGEYKGITEKGLAALRLPFYEKRKKKRQRKRR